MIYLPERTRETLIADAIGTAADAIEQHAAETDELPPVDVALPEYADELYQPHRYKVLYGGRGGARSWSVARALLKMGHERPLRIAALRELQTSIKDSVHRLLSDQIEHLGLPYQVLETEIRHPHTGTLILFKGLRHNVTTIKSMEGIDIAWVEEAERVSKESWEVLIPTIRKDGSEIWVTFNPDLETDPTYQRMVLQAPPEAWVKKVTWRDNPWFPEALRKEKDWLYKVDPDAAAHVWGGDCREATDAQIMKGKWTVQEFEPGEGWDGPYHGADFGFAQDPTTLVKCWIHARRLYIEREAYKIGLELDHTPEHWRLNVPGCDQYVIRADSARPESISYLQRHGFSLITGVKKWPGSVEDGIAHLRQYEQIIIHPNCRHAADEARHYSYKTDQRTGDVLPEVVDKHNHIWDPVRYALAPLIQQRGAPGAWTW